MILSFLVFLHSAFAVNVVCTVPYLGDIAHRIAPSATVTTLARATDDPHSLSPTPALIAKVTAADLYVENGMSLELWSERLLDSAGNPKVRRGQFGYVRATDGVTRLDVPADLTRAKGDMHPEGNPHIWTDPLNTIQVANNISAGLGRVDPVNAGTYAANAAAFKAKIQESMYGADLVKYMGGDLLVRMDQQGKLDDFLAGKGLSSRLGGWKAKGASLKGKAMVFYHQSWPYFIKRFGVNAIGYVEDRPGIAPTAAHRDQLLSLMKTNNVKVIEVTSYYDPKIAQLLAGQTGAKVAIVAGDVGGTSAASDYFAYITSIITAFTQ